MTKHKIVLRAMRKSNAPYELDANYIQQLRLFYEVNKGAKHRQLYMSADGLGMLLNAAEDILRRRIAHRARSSEYRKRSLVTSKRTPVRPTLHGETL